MERCDAYHDGHDCTQPGACTRALWEMLNRSIELEEAMRAEFDQERREVRS